MKGGGGLDPPVPSPWFLPMIEINIIQRTFSYQTLKSILTCICPGKTHKGAVICWCAWQFRCGWEGKVEHTAAPVMERNKKPCKRIERWPFGRGVLLASAFSCQSANSGRRRTGEGDKASPCIFTSIRSCAQVCLAANTPSAYSAIIRKCLGSVLTCPP